MGGGDSGLQHADHAWEKNAPRKASRQIGFGFGLRSNMGSRAFEDMSDHGRRRPMSGNTCQVRSVEFRQNIGDVTLGRPDVQKRGADGQNVIDLTRMYDTGKRLSHD